MENQTVIHINQGQKFRVCFERAANVRTDGFKVEVNDDSLAEVFEQARTLYQQALQAIEANKPAPPEMKK